MSLLEQWPDLLTVQEAAEILRADPSAVEIYIRSGEVKHAEIAGKTLIPKRFLEEFIAKSCKMCYNEGVEIDPLHLDNCKALDYMPSKGELTMAKITRTVTINGVKHWIRASTEQEYADKLLKLVGTQAAAQEPVKHLFADYAMHGLKPTPSPI